MLQVKKGQASPFKIKRMRKIPEAERLTFVAGCPGEAPKGTDKPPC